MVFWLTRLKKKTLDETLMTSRKNIEEININ